MSLVLETGEPLRPGMLPEQDAAVLENMAQESGSVHIIGSGPTASVSVSSAAHFRFGDGTALDVVPRGFDRSSFSRMMHEIFNLDYRDAEGEDLFEVLVMLFVREVSDLVRKGLKFAYSLVQANETSFKGRLLVAEHLRENLIHKERVYVEYELFTPDRAENRLIKSTLQLLLKRSVSSRNRRDIKTLLAELEEVPSSEDVRRDLGRVNLDRNMVDYISAVGWCRIFLNALGVGGSARGGTSFAVTADPERVMEAYVARASSRGREDGSFSARCRVEMHGEAGSAVIDAEPAWMYYDRKRRTRVDDAGMLYRTAPGYGVIPFVASGETEAAAMARRCLEEAGV